MGHGRSKNVGSSVMIQVQPESNPLSIRFKGFDEDDTTIWSRGDIRGKLMLCDNFLCEWLPSWLEESKIDY